MSKLYILLNSVKKSNNKSYSWHNISLRIKSYLIQNTTHLS